MSFVANKSYRIDARDAQKQKPRRLGSDIENSLRRPTTTTTHTKHGRSIGALRGMWENPLKTVGLQVNLQPKFEDLGRPEKLRRNI